MRGVILLAVLALAACGTTEHIRLDQAPQDTAEAAGCSPLPLCEIPPGANSTQLESALWACVLEYRALYSACYHLAHPQLPAQGAIPKLPPTAYGVSWCTATNPPVCIPARPALVSR